MANYNNPNGFRPISADAKYGKYTVKASTTVTRGDALAIVSGVVLPMLWDGTHDQILGVAAENGTGGDVIHVYDQPGTIFEGQCSGTYAKTSHDGARVGFEGTTGAMQVNENATSGLMGKILRHAPRPGAEDVGDYARVAFVFTSMANGSAPGDQTFDALTANTVTVGGLELGAAVDTLTNGGAGHTTIADITTAAVTGVDGTGANAASKADVDTAFTAYDAKINAILARLETAGISAAS